MSPTKGGEGRPKILPTKQREGIRQRDGSDMEGKSTNY